LFTVLGRLREMGVALSAPQSMVVINEVAEKAAAPSTLPL
jgi:potassium efflux system protein